MPTTDPNALNPYHRPVTFTHEGQEVTVYLDCYDVAILSKRNQDGTMQPAKPSDWPLAQAGKKIRYAGQRGKKSLVQDLIEARMALDRAIELEMGDDGA